MSYIDLLFCYSIIIIVFVPITLSGPPKAIPSLQVKPVREKPNSNIPIQASDLGVAQNSLPSNSFQRDQSKLNQPQSQNSSKSINKPADLRFKRPSEKDKANPAPLLHDVYDILPADHMDGVPIEHDGHLNRQYKSEILLGEVDPHEAHFGKGDPKRLLERIFRKADSPPRGNGDGFWSRDELAGWITYKIAEHMRAAEAANTRLFKALDEDEDEKVTWEEFAAEALTLLNYPVKTREQRAALMEKLRAAEQQQPPKATEEHPTGHEEWLGPHLPLHAMVAGGIPVSEMHVPLIERNAHRWAIADFNRDGALSEPEFVAFRHPELHNGTVMHLAREILERLDANGDGELAIEEFARNPHAVDKVADVQQAVAEGEYPGDWSETRAREFRTEVDINGDGRASLQELIFYVHPLSAAHAQREALALIELADIDSDGRLSLQEVLDNPELFLASEAVRVARKFHDEF